MGFYGRMAYAFGVIWLPLLVLLFTGTRIVLTPGLFWVTLAGCALYAVSSPNRVRQLREENARLRGQLGMTAAAPPPLVPPATAPRG